MKTIKIILKSGYEQLLTAREISISKNGFNDLTEIEYKGAIGGSIAYIRLEDISAIVWVRDEKEESK